MRNTTQNQSRQTAFLRSTSNIGALLRDIGALVNEYAGTVDTTDPASHEDMRDIENRLEEIKDSIRITLVEIDLLAEDK